MKNEDVKTILDLTVFNREYHCMIAGVLITDLGEIDILCLIYKEMDTDFVCKGRLKFKSGNKIQFQNQYDSLLNAIKSIEDMRLDFPGVKEFTHTIIENPSLKGNDMLNALIASDVVEMERKEVYEK